MDKNDQIWEKKVNNVSSYISKKKETFKMDIDEKEVIYHQEDTTTDIDSRKKQTVR